MRIKLPLAHRTMLLLLFFPTLAFGADSLTDIVKKIQPTVVTVVTFGLNKNVTGLGSGFFINNQGHLITSHHVLNSAYSAEIRTPKGQVYPIERILAESGDMDLIKVQVTIPAEAYAWVNISPNLPEIAERVVVVGSPLGLEQTVSDGIVSAIREMPQIGAFFQMSAPISRGSSGGPVVNMAGDVVGVVTFMLVKGQNLNFAVAGKSILELKDVDFPRTVSDWTYSASLKAPRMAEDLCRIGLNYSIEGRYNKALEYYKAATIKDPKDPMAWYGLTHCFHGLEKPEEVVSTFIQAIEANPEDALLRYNLGNYYARVGRYKEAINAYRKSIDINPVDVDAHENLGLSQAQIGRFKEALDSQKNVVAMKPDYAQGHFHLGITLSELGRTEEALEAYKKTVGLNPDFLPAFSHMGFIYTQLGRGLEAVESHKQVIRINPAHAEGHYNLGVAYLLIGDKISALDQYKILKRFDRKAAERLFGMIYE